jgi:hypothetical protein
MNTEWNDDCQGIIKIRQCDYVHRTSHMDWSGIEPETAVYWPVYLHKDPLINVSIWWSAKEPEDKAHISIALYNTRNRAPKDRWQHHYERSCEELWLFEHGTWGCALHTLYSVATVKIQVQVFWVVTPCSVSDGFTVATLHGVTTQET